MLSFYIPTEFERVVICLPCPELENYAKIMAVRGRP